MPLDNQIIVPKYFSGNYTETVLTPQQISAVALTGNQTVSGTKTFALRPTVNGTGILLSGEASSLPNTVVYTTGNQTITGLKSFSDVTVTNKITLRNVETSWGGIGSGVYFSQPNNSATQIIDYIDTNLSIARGNVQSIYNAALENAWNGSGPSGTRWNRSGYDDLGNVASRTYDSLLNTFTGAIGANIVGSPLVMHDSINNKYYKILFNNWQQGGVAAGTYAGFSYTRWLIVNPTYPYPTVSGEKLNFKNKTEFDIRPIVNGTGILLSGEVVAQLPNTIVYNTGNQTISGAKTFVTGIVAPNLVYNTGNQTISGIKTFIDKPTYGNSQVYIESGRSANISENQIVYVPQFDNINTLNFDATLVYISSSGLLRLPTGVHNLSFGQTQYLNILLTGPGMAGGTFYVQNPIFGFVSGQLTQIGWENIYETKSISYNYLNLYKRSNSLTWDLNKNKFITDLEQQNQYFVNTTGNQTISGIKNFIDNVYIKNLFVTGTETIVSTTNFNVQSPYLLLNLTGGAVDGGIFFVTGSGLSGINNYGPIIGFDHTDKFKFGIARRSDDLSVLNDIAAVQDITNYSGFVDSNFYPTNNPSGYITGVNLSNYITKTSGQFLDRPTVNGTGVLLSGEAAGSANFRYFPASGVVNLLSNNRYSFDTFSGLVTGILPANPQKGDEIELYDSAGAWHINPLIIDNNGNYIEQKKDKLECNVRHGLIKLIYTTQNNIGWRIYPMPIHNVPLFLPPIPAISTSSISGFAPLTLTFTGVNLQTPAEFSPVDHWYWNVSGDSAPEFDQSVITYTFNETGNYTFYLTAVNAAGSGLASGTFSILEVPPITTGADPYSDYVTLLLHFN
jgi:hypothetical protein